MDYWSTFFCNFLFLNLIISFLIKEKKNTHETATVCIHGMKSYEIIDGHVSQIIYYYISYATLHLYFRSRGR